MAEIREGDRVTLRGPWVANHREQYRKMFGTESGMPDDLQGTVRTVTTFTIRVADSRKTVRAPKKAVTRTTVLIDWDAAPGREGWTARYPLSAVKHHKPAKAKAVKETWKRTPVRDLAEGDVIETPHNEASESVTYVRPIGRDWFALGVTGQQERRVPGRTEVLKLYR
jgi:hypothetical protein